MKILDLPVETRDNLGSAHARRYRRAGMIPCHLYGRGQPNVNLVMKAADFGQVLKGHTALVRLALGEQKQTALIREVRWDTFGESVEHVDLTRVEMEDEVRIAVPVHVHGVPAGASEGGTTQLVKADLDLLARADSIPEEILIDISGLHINDALHIGDIAYPENVRPDHEPDEVIVIIQPPKKAEEPGEAEAGEEAEAAEAPEKPAEGESGEE